MGRAARALLLLVAAVVGGSLLIAAPGSWAASAAAPLPQDAARGRDLYIQIGCYQCHGFEGQGAGPTGPRLAPVPIAFARFRALVWEPLDLMPRYSPDWVSEQDLADI